MSYYSVSQPNLNYGNVTINPGTSGGYYTMNATSTSATWASVTNPVTITQQAKIELKGEDADIIMNGESLNQTLKEIKDALRIPSKLNRDEKLEKEWAELQEAADHYNKLLEEYREKQKVWDTLKD
jgi:predicted dehydrogenase